LYVHTGDTQHVTDDANAVHPVAPLPLDTDTPEHAVDVMQMPLKLPDWHGGPAGAG